MNEKGLVQIYTGDGKGKTTASLGLSLRALGNGLKVCYVYFFKNFDKHPTGEILMLEKLGVKFYNFSPDTPLFNPSVSPESVREACLRGIKFIQKEIFANNPPDLLVLDEINNALPNRYLLENEMLEIIKSKPDSMEMVLTGRGATPKIIEAADLVSKIEKIKHPFDKGITRRKGIEY